MFAPLVAKAQSKAGGSSTNPSASQRSILGAQSFGRSAAEQAKVLQRRADNQQTFGQLVQPGSRFAGYEDAPRASWDFGKIPLFPPNRANRSETRSALSAPPRVIQPKLVVGQVNDPLESEADRAAERLMRAPEPAAVLPKGTVAALQRKCEACKEQEKHESLKLARARTGDASVFDGTTAPAIVHEVLRSPGQALEPSTRAFFEPRFGHDFSRVRLHTGSQAADSARVVGARAYTKANDLVFGAGEYAPQSSVGLGLLAHELAHVVQHHSDPSPRISRQPTPKQEPLQKQDPEPRHEQVPKQEGTSTPASAQNPAQKKESFKDRCAKLDLNALHLPRKNNSGAEFFEVSAASIRILAAVSSKDAAQVKANYKTVVAHLGKLNRLVADPSKRINLMIVTNGSSEARVLCGTSVQILDPQDFNAETATHETMHGVTGALVQQEKGTGAPATGAKNFLDKMADIFLQLKKLSIHLSPGNDYEATNLVDPQTLDPKEHPEHPQDNVDEFTSSAVAVFLTNKKGLEKKILEFGKKDPKLAQAGKELTDLLTDALENGNLPPAQLAAVSSAKDIGAQFAAIEATKDVDDATIATHGLLPELLFP